MKAYWLATNYFNHSNKRIWLETRQQPPANYVSDTVTSTAATFVSANILSNKGVTKYWNTTSEDQSPLVISSSREEPCKAKYVQPPRLSEWQENSPGSNPAKVEKNLTAVFRAV